MKLSINAVINENLTVSFDVLTFVSMVVYLFQRATNTVAAEVMARVPASDHCHPADRMVMCPLDLSPGRFKISLIKMVRHLPAHTFDLRQAKDIVEFVFENQSAIERLSEVAR
jgi:ribosomal protein L7/L12